MFVRWCSRVSLSFRVIAFSVTTYLFVIATLPTFAVEALPPPPELKNPQVGANLAGFFTGKTPYEFWLSCLICIFGLAVIYALLFGLRRSANARPEDVARPIIVVTIIIGTLMLITVGYNNEQIAPAFGLFGTIVGYMLGRYSQSQQPAESSPDPRIEPTRP